MRAVSLFVVLTRQLRQLVAIHKEPLQVLQVADALWQLTQLVVGQLRGQYQDQG